MTFYFAWINSKDAFDPERHCRHDVEILSFEIAHNEGQLPLLTMVVSSFSVPSFVSCYLSYREDGDEKNPVIVVFKGILYHAPLNPNTHTWTLHFKVDFDGSRLSSLSVNVSHPVADDIVPLEADFFKECSGHVDLTKKLQRQCSVVEVDRTTQAVKLCDLFQMEDIFHPQDIFEKSIQLQVLESPYTQVDVTITADWMQKEGGEVDLSSCLHKAFPEGRVNTLTPKYMEASFPKVGAILSVNYDDGKGSSLGHVRSSKSSGYRVVESWMRSFEPPHTGVLATYPRVSPPFWEKNYEDVPPRQVYFKRVWYQTALVVEWHYRQRRRENITVSLKNVRVSKGRKRPKKLTLTLQTLQDHHGSSFFKSMMGRRALLFAYDYGCCFLKASTRCFELSFRLPLVQGLSLSTMQMVDISKMLHQQGIDVKRPVYGKIVAYRLVQKGLYGYALVRCAFSLPGENVNEVELSFEADHRKSAYVEDGFLKDHMVQGHEYQEFFDRVIKDIHPQGLKETHLFHTDFIVEKIHVDNHVQQQIQQLHHDAYPSMGRLKHSLKKCPTTFSMQLRDLRTYPLLEQNSEVICSVIV